MKRLLELLVGVAIVVSALNNPCYADPVTFSDDFNDGAADGWIFASGDSRAGDPNLNWSVSAGRLVENSGWDAQFALVGGLSFASQSIEARVEIQGWAGITLWYQDLNNYVVIGKYPSAYGSGIYVGEMINGVSSETAVYAYYGLQGGTFDFRLDADSATGEIQFFVGGDHIFTHTVQNSSRSGLSGFVSGNGGAYFDNFLVTSSETNSVPEASTLFLFGVGLIGLAGYRRTFGSYGTFLHESVEISGRSS